MCKEDSQWSGKKRKVTNKDNNVAGNHLEVMFKFSIMGKYNRWVSG